MDIYVYQECKNHLLATYQYMCPTGKEYAAYVKSLHELELRGEDRKAIIKTLTGLLYDGLAYGNWGK